MSPRFVICVLAFLAFAAVIDGCDKKAKKPQNLKHRKGREVDAPIMVGESEFGLLLRPRNTKEASKNTHAEVIFRKIDTNSDNMVDAAEWVDYSKDATSIWDFVELLGYTDINDDEVISLDELLSVQIVKFDQSTEKKDDAGDTSS